MLLGVSFAAHAMNFKRVGTTLILSGEVVARDLEDKRGQAPLFEYLIRRQYDGANFKPSRISKFEPGALIAKFNPLLQASPLARRWTSNS